MAWILPLAIDDDFEVNVTAGGVSRGAGTSNDLSLAYLLAHPNKDQRVMAVAGHDPVAVVNGDAVTRVPSPGRYDDFTIFAGSYWRAASNRIILADVDLPPRTCRVSSPPIRA